MELTDGFQIVTAIEYSPIPCLKTSLVPGIKMLLIGPVRCINQCLLIDSKNIKILAGEISNMNIKNAYENVLRRILNQPINPNPKMDETGLKPIDKFEEETFDILVLFYVFFKTQNKQWWWKGTEIRTKSHRFQ